MLVVVMVENVQHESKMLEGDIDHKMVVDNNCSYYKGVEEQEDENYYEEFVLVEENEEEN
jgi:hypothetical protein